MILQLDPTIPVETPRGKGFAHFLIDYGSEHHLLWTVFLNDSGECWTFKNPEIRLESNPTMGTHSTCQRAAKPNVDTLQPISESIG
jgi:hypothetical protein